MIDDVLLHNSLHAHLLHVNRLNHALHHDTLPHRLHHLLLHDNLTLPTRSLDRRNHRQRQDRQNENQKRFHCLAFQNREPKTADLIQLANRLLIEERRKVIGLLATIADRLDKVFHVRRRIAPTVKHLHPGDRR